MQFQHPEILYFLFLLVIPILVHLFQLRKFKTEYFTNVKFLKELVVQTRKSSKIKKYLLLATRLLLLAALILAFAKPFFIAKDHKDAKNELYIVLDNSFSMQAKGQKGELLKRAVQDLLEHTPEGANFSLLTCTDNYWNTDIKSIQKELQNLKYSATPFQLESILSKIKAHKSAFRKDIVVITDAVGLQSKNTPSKSEDENLYYIISEAEKTNNISIDSVFINQTMDNFYEIGVKLAAYGEDFNDIPIALFNKNKLVAKTLVNLESKNKVINFTIPKADFHGYVSVSDNSLEYDNSYYFSLSKPQKSNVISIGNTDKSQFLSRIYTDSEFNYSNTELSGLDYNSIEKQDAIVLNELKEIPQALQTTLKSFAEKGGNIIFIPSEEASVTNMNAFLSTISSIQYKTKNNNEKLVTKINFSHPLFSSVFEKQVTNFQFPKTKTSFEISNTSPVALGFNDQTAFLSSSQSEVATAYVFSAPLNKLNSNFQNSPIVVPVFYNMGQNAQKAGINVLEIGENKPFLVDSKLGKDEIVTVKNNKESFIPLQQLLNNKVKITCNENPKEAGNFGIFNNQVPVNTISFNYSRTESNLDNINTDSFNNYKEISNVSSIFDTLQANRSDNQMWKLFILLSLLFITLEVLIQKFVK